MGTLDVRLHDKDSSVAASSDKRQALDVKLAKDIVRLCVEEGERTVRKQVKVDGIVLRDKGKIRYESVVVRRPTITSRLGHVTQLRQFVRCAVLGLPYKDNDVTLRLNDPDSVSKFIEAFCADLEAATTIYKAEMRSASVQAGYVVPKAAAVMEDTVYDLVAVAVEESSEIAQLVLSEDFQIGLRQGPRSSPTFSATLKLGSFLKKMIELINDLRSGDGSVGKLLDSADKLCLPDTLQRKFVAAVAGQRGIPYFKKMLPEPLHLLLRVADKLISLNAIFQYLVTGRKQDLINAYNAAGEIVRFRRKAFIMSRYADALAAKGQAVAGWAEVEARGARYEDARRMSTIFALAVLTPQNRRAQTIVQRTQSAAGSAFDSLVDTSKPLPVVDHLAMLFILGTTVITVTVNLNAAVIGFTVAFHLLRKVGGERWQFSDLTVGESDQQPHIWCCLGIFRLALTTSLADESKHVRNTIDSEAE
jgi:hypothetical protein